MTGRYEVILAGSGGQGLVVSGIMLGEAAILEGKNVVQTVAHGIASRGGFSQAEVIIDREEIIFQQVQHPDIVLALTAEAMDMYAGLAGTGTRVFCDAALLNPGGPQAAARQFGEKGRTGDLLSVYPFSRLAAEYGEAAVNMIALGAIAAATGLVRVESLEKVIRRFAPAAAAANVKALHAGAGLVTEAAGRS